MALRVSQHYIGVIGKAPGALRVSQAYLSVLLRRHEFDGRFEDTLAFTSDFTKTLEGGGGSPETPVSWTNTLLLTSQFSSLSPSKEVIDSLSLSDSFIGASTKQIIPQTLTFSESFIGAATRQTIEQAIALTDEFESILVGPIGFSNTLSLTDSFGLVKVGDFNHVIRYFDPIAQAYVGLDDIFSYTFGVKNVTIEQTLSFAQGYGLAREVSWSDTLVLVDEFGLPLVQELEFMEAWTESTSKAVYQDLDLTDGFTFTIDQNEGLTQSLALSQTFKAVTTASDCQYQLPNPPVLGHATLMLTYGMTSVILRNPVFNNTVRKGYTRIQRETRGGALKTYADPIWPKTTTLIFTIQALPNPQELLTFLEDSLGQEITLLDHENRQWTGVITNPNTAVTDNGTCNAEVQLEFMGELV